MSISDLKKLIFELLSPYIDRDYYLLDIPNHYNVGDSLILLGEQAFLSQINHKCLGTYTLLSFDDNCLEDGSLVLLQGGGFWGDLWRKKTLVQDLMLRHPNCNYLIFPQSVFYTTPERLHYDMEVFSKCSHVTICARDNISYQILTTNFKFCRILLVPDMAFCIDTKALFNSSVIKENLYLCRYDRERNPNQDKFHLPKCSDKGDWPTMKSSYFISYPQKLSVKARNILGNKIKILNEFENYYWQKFIYPQNIKVGSLFISKYNNIYTTRLHGAILGLLLGKKVYLYRNSYHKIESFYNTWLLDNDNIELI